jgi:endonuclease YncB( thermonuclease family)
VTPADEARFIALWQQGASQQELAQRLGVPVGTIKSRAAALARQGYAEVDTVPPNVKYQDHFVRLQREAREAGRGCWGEVR